MANTFKNAGVAVGTTRTEVYVCPSATQAVVNAVYLSNIDGTNSGTVGLFWRFWLLDDPSTIFVK